MNGPLPDDAIHAADMIAGSEALWQAVTQAQLRKPHKTPAGLVWKRTSILVDASPEAAARQARQNADRQAREAFLELNRVSRDPCPKCAVRADIGCKHRRVG